MSSKINFNDEEAYQDSDSLIGKALGREISESLDENELGVTVESPPEFDLTPFFAELDKGNGYNIGLGLVGISEANIPQLKNRTQESSIRITDKPSDAIKWRNGTETEFEWDGQKIPDRTVILVRGDPPKLGSLHRLRSIPLGKLRKRISVLMRNRPEFEGNAPAESVWRTIESGFGTNLDILSIAEYSVSTIKDTNQESLDALGEELYNLGLFTDSNLLQKASEVPDRLEANLELVGRIKHITNQDKRRLMNSIRSLEGEERQEQAEFVETLRRFQRTKDEELLKDLEYNKVTSSLSTTSRHVSETKSSSTGGTETTTSSGSGRGRGQRYKTRTDHASASVDLSFNDRDEDLEEISQEFESKFQEAVDEGRRRVDIPAGDNEKVAIDIEPDIYQFIKKFVDEDSFGGIIHQAESREDAIENFNSLSIDFFRIHSEESNFEKLRKFAERNEEFESLVQELENYSEKRSELVDSLPGLLHAPLMKLLGDEDLLQNAIEYLEAYSDTQKKLDNKYRSLQDASSKGASKLLSEFLLLDTIIIETEEEREVILSPLHPLHLWKYVELAKETTDNRDSLSDDEKEFLSETVEEQPHVLRSINIGGGRILSEEKYLLQSEEVAKLPVYTEAETADPGSNTYLWDYLINKFTSAYPPSKDHLKINIVDPIDSSELLEKVVKAVDKGQINGVTVEFAFVNNEPTNILGGFTSSTQEDIISLFGPEGNSDSFQILTNEFQNFQRYIEYLEDHPCHFVVVNDKSSFYIEEFERDLDTSINPLYVPKEFEYDEFEDELNISASNEGRLFSEYQDLVNQLYNQRQKLHNASVHELDTNKEIVQAIEENSLWTCVSTPSLNTDPFWEKDLISRERRGDREYAIYSQDIGLFTRTLRRILNEYPIAPETADIEKVAERIVNTERSGLLRLITEETISSQQSRNLKGLLGSIISVQWMEEQFEDPKMIFSIDDPRTREWLNFGSSNKRADFLVVEPKGEDGLTIDIVEVKTLDDPEAAFSIREEDGDKIISGKAVDQMVETTETIRGLFDKEDNVTTPPRREALREQIYYELIGSDVPGDKNEWVERINNVFRGDAQVDIEPRIVSVEITNPENSSTNIECLNENSQKLFLSRLPKETIVRLIMNGTDEYPEEDGKSEKIEEVEEVEEVEEKTVSEKEEQEVDEKEEAEPELEKQSETSQEFGKPEEYQDQVEELKRVLAEFGVDIKDIDPKQVEVGSNIIRYKVELSPGQKQDAIERRSEDIAREMALEREPIIHRLPGTKYVAIDVPREETQIVRIEDYLDDLPSSSEITMGELPFIGGIKPAGDSYIADLKDAPHMLVGGTTGSGKTVFLYSMLVCFLERQEAGDLELAIIDPKLTNFMFFNSLPNLKTDQVITDSQSAFDLFEWIVEEEMPRRTKVLGQSGSVDIREHNERSSEPLKPLVVVIDEYADLIDGLGDDSDEFEKNVRRIAQKARSLGIHLVIATQRPSAKIIDTDLRANLDMRVAFRLPSASDSNIVLDESGAEELGGNGDMLFRTADDLIRLQGTLTDTDYLRDLIDRIS